MFQVMESVAMLNFLAIIKRTFFGWSTMVQVRIWGPMGLFVPRDSDFHRSVLLVKE